MHIDVINPKQQARTKLPLWGNVDFLIAGVEVCFSRQSNKKVRIGYAITFFLVEGLSRRKRGGLIVWIRKETLLLQFMHQPAKTYMRERSAAHVLSDELSHFQAHKQRVLLWGRSYRMTKDSSAIK